MCRWLVHTRRWLRIDRFDKSDYKVNKRLINRLSEFVKLSFRALDLRWSDLSEGLWVI